MIRWVRCQVQRWFVRRAFTALRMECWSQVQGPGMIPLPWRGPNNEVVLVTLDARGRMTALPRAITSPREMVAAMGLEPPPTERGFASVFGARRADGQDAARLVS